MPSPAELVADKLYREGNHLSDAERRQLARTLLRRKHDWRFWARPNQLEPPGKAWQIWANVAGRGSGKTRTGAEYMIDRSRQYHRAGIKHRGGLVGRTAADVRDTMVEGDSGLMACLEGRKIRAKYEPGKRRVVIKALDSIVHTYSAMEPESLRGPQHHTLWCDEPGAWRQKVDAQGNTAWTNGLFGLRLDAPGLIPRVIATTTPKPVPLIKEWFDATKPCRRPAGHKGTHGARQKGDTRDVPELCGKIDHRIVLTGGALYDNIAHLAPAFVAQIVERYRYSPLGAQEIMGQLVLSVEGALWDMARIEATRVRSAPPLSRVIVAVDPPGETIAECGIVVMGIDNTAREVYILDDLSMRGRGEEWGAAVIKAYRDHNAGLVVAEKNQGGDMVRTVIHLQDASVLYHGITSSVDKWTRAEPVSSAYDRVHHVDYFPDLESQMCTWTDAETYSPDRLDALVHGVRYLLPAIIAPPAQSKSAADVTLSSLHTQRGDPFGG